MRLLARLLLAGAFLVTALVALLRWQAPARIPPLPPLAAETRQPDPGQALIRRMAALAAPARLERRALDVFRRSSGRVGGGGPGSVEEVFPPLDFQASPQEGGIRLSWVQDPRNPVEDLRYVLTRWVGDGGAEDLPGTSQLEYLDAVSCEGIPYHYRIHSEIRRELSVGAGAHRWETRSSEPASASCTLPRRSEWSTRGEADEGRLWLTLRRPGHPELGPYAAGPGEPIGDTGWFLEGLTLRETRLQVETKIPRFDALGRRVIIDGRPADRTRLVTVTPLLASLRFSDPCGASVALELLLPLEPSSPEEG